MTEKDPPPLYAAKRILLFPINQDPDNPPHEIAINLFDGSHLMYAPLQSVYLQGEGSRITHLVIFHGENDIEKVPYEDAESFDVRTSLLPPSLLYSGINH